jgi:hypothetical protein
MKGKSMEYKWEITYKIVGDNTERIMEKELHLKTAHKVGKWFKLCYNGIDGKQKKLEFINAKIKEENDVSISETN